MGDLFYSSVLKLLLLLAVCTGAPVAEGIFHLVHNNIDQHDEAPHDGVPPEQTTCNNNSLSREL